MSKRIILNQGCVVGLDIVQVSFLSPSISTHPLQMNSSMLALSLPDLIGLDSCNSLCLFCLQMGCTETALKS